MVMVHVSLGPWEPLVLHTFVVYTCVARKGGVRGFSQAGSHPGGNGFCGEP